MFHMEKRSRNTLIIIIIIITKTTNQKAVARNDPPVQGQSGQHIHLKCRNLGGLKPSKSHSWFKPIYIVANIPDAFVLRGQPLDCLYTVAMWKSVSNLQLFSHCETAYLICSFFLNVNQGIWSVASFLEWECVELSRICPWSS